MSTFEQRQAAAKRLYDEKEAAQAKGPDNGKDAFRTPQIFRFLTDPQSRGRLMADVIFAADWFEHPNVMGRDPRGEADFQAIRLVPLYHVCYDALDETAKASLDRFFFDRDYSSIYGSENHALMYRVVRFLAAQFHKNSDRRFTAFGGLTPEEVYAADKAFIGEFLDFRAKYAWGEFDSLGYAVEILLILATLFAYTDDDGLKNKAGMAMDLILLDMIADSRYGLYGGAHGRSYPGAVLDTAHAGMFHVYCYYFGSRFENLETLSVPYALLLSPYRPDDIICAVESGRTYPYLNREVKHLHSMSSWSGREINHETLGLLENCHISKRTYVGERYMLGGICRQDAYPADCVNDAGYAHHQQHEWELTLYGGTDHKIFTHHPGDPGYHHIHNRFTGDTGCNCGTFYQNDNTAISLYDIKNPHEYPYINAYVPLDVFDEVKKDGKYLFLAYPGLYISLYFSAGYRVNDFDEYAGREILADGRHHAVILRVEEADKFASLDAFAGHIKAIPVCYDPIRRTVAFDGIRVWYDGNGEGGKDNVYPYPYLYENPFMKAERGTGRIVVEIGGRRKVYDFGNA